MLESDNGDPWPEMHRKFWPAHPESGKLIDFVGYWLPGVMQPPSEWVGYLIGENPILDNASRYGQVEIGSGEANENIDNNDREVSSSYGEVRH